MFDFIIAGWQMSLLVVLASSSLALLVRILCGSQQGWLTRLCTLFMVLLFLLGSLRSGIQRLLLHWLQEDFSTSLF